MKKQLILCFALVALAFTTKAQSTFDAWPELKAFHTVMSATFHPAEEGNLKPIKAQSADLAAKAAKLQNSLPPKEFSKPTIIAAVKKLATESKALDLLIKKKAKDAIILKNLTALHNRFHEIVGLCKEEKH
jgi:Tfp pilus assembly protein PilO